MISFGAFLKNLRTRAGSRPGVQLTPGLYHYVREGIGERSRIHLRIEPDGHGLLLVNASRVLHLNPTATLMARLALDETLPDQAVQTIRHTFDVPAAQASNDYAQFRAQLAELIRPDGACPIHDLELEVTAPFSARPSAPYRMDLALTYRCNNDCAHCYNARSRSYPELSTAQWKTIIEQLWQIGIPHVVFTGGEPSLRDDLPELVAHAEQIGQVTGLNTNGRRLSDRRFVDRRSRQAWITFRSPWSHTAPISTTRWYAHRAPGSKRSLACAMFWIARCL